MQSPQCKKDRIGPRYFASGTKYIHCTKPVDQGEACIAGGLFSSAGLSSCLLLLEAGVLAECFSSRGASPLNLQGSDGLRGSYLRAAPGHPSARWRALWLVVVSGPVHCPVEQWLCSRLYSLALPLPAPLGVVQAVGCWVAGPLCSCPRRPPRCHQPLGITQRQSWSGLTPSEWQQNTLMIPD